nr:front end desaturase B [Namalycastis rhodochorde]
MGKGTNTEPEKNFTWDEVKQHTKITDRWVVIDNNIYDVTRFQKRHPGGARILSHFAGQDATEVWLAMHKNQSLSKKYMASICVGQVKEPCNYDKARAERQKDVEELRQTALKNGWFKSNPWFFIAHISSIVGFEVLGYFIMSTFGVSWPVYLVATACLVTTQAQAGWSQHDYGHWSVFKNRKANHAGQQFLLGFIKGASKQWWNFRHNQHHAKPNIYKKDPDITFPKDVFLFGTRIPVLFGKDRKKNMPYNYEHLYFWIFGPAALLPIIVNIEMIYFIVKRRDWYVIKDALAMTAFFARYIILYGPFLGGWWGAIKLYFFVRFFESWWFTFCTQMSHIPMKVDYDADDDWLVSQTMSTRNIRSSFFNDWFSGHLNFQIEHHMFPTMPRHNYHKVQPLVKSLCKKHNLPYIEKPMITAFADIVSSLKKSGELWYDAYYHP